MVQESLRQAWKDEKAFYLQREASSCSSTFFFVCPTYSPVRFRPEVSATGNWQQNTKHETLGKKTNQRHVSFHVIPAQKTKLKENPAGQSCSFPSTRLTESHVPQCAPRHDTRHCGLASSWSACENEMPQLRDLRALLGNSTDAQMQHFRTTNVWQISC